MVEDEWEEGDSGDVRRGRRKDMAGVRGGRETYSKGGDGGTGMGVGDSFRGVLKGFSMGREGERWKERGKRKS